MKDISVIIIYFNTKEIIKKSLESLYLSLNKDNLLFEVIVVDNASTDGSIELLEKLSLRYKNFVLIKNKKNVGYSKANNIGIKFSKGKYILLLNSDALVQEGLKFSSLINYLEQNKNCAGLTVKVVLPSGKIDPASHRGFPTLWNSFCYFSRLERLFSKVPYLNRVFGGYHGLGKDIRKVHRIDAVSGAFFLVKSAVIKKLGGFDEEFFMYGEDLDLAFRIKEANKYLVYYPKFSVLHLKYKSGLSHESNTIRKKTRFYFYDAMRIFYKKHYERHNFYVVNKIVYSLINLLSKKDK